MHHLCPNCGLPTSRWDDADSPAAGWYCDGPNDSTTEAGCFHLAVDPWPSPTEADRRAEADRRSDLADAAHDAENQS